MASANPAPFGGRVQIKILIQILVHGNEKFQKIKVFEALQVGFLSKYFFVGELYLDNTAYIYLHKLNVATTNL